MGLPAFWTKLALAGSARVALLSRALHTYGVHFDKARGRGECYSDVSPTGLAATNLRRTRIAPAKDSDTIFLQEVRAGLMAMSEVPAVIYMDNTAALANLKRGKLPARVLFELENIHLLYFFNYLYLV